ncbi:MAG TPA: UDP-N-acetylmuramoyl-tripeptide--D-alanyl-D-alanine ligase, partial [Aggregatilineales bacterium]|nr:UDP-N-acetylmuramoyl-tripeptide--D-alanyl-D-alanine ligase [Aggregatilineales bacterium]
FVIQLAEIDVPLISFLFWVVVAGYLVLPEPVKETKKEFVRTPRAMRIILTAFVLLALLIVILSLFFTRNMGGDAQAQLSTVSIVGFIAYLLSPMALSAGNVLMHPVEEKLRGRFRERARQKLIDSGATVIGITGSYGKTSTKTYLAHILSGRYKVLPTPRSYNTLMGVSLAINEDLDLAFGYNYFIAEMGAYVPGEIAEICELVKPKISIVTAVGAMHLERFGSIENVIRAKYEIVEGLPPDGLAVFNGDDANVLGMAERGYPENRIMVSRDGLEAARFIAENIIHSLDGLSFDVIDRETGETHHFNTKLVGLHNVTNILLAAAVARHTGLSLAEIGSRVASLTPAEHRLRQNLMPGGITVIDDAYSANPVGASSALEVLSLHMEGRRILITPGMVELGDLQDEENYKLGKLAAESASDIVLVGIEQTRSIQRGIAESDFDSSRLLVVDTFEEARNWFQVEVKP